LVIFGTESSSFDNNVQYSECKYVHICMIRYSKIFYKCKYLHLWIRSNNDNVDNYLQLLLNYISNSTN
jgi:hypothetical protein